MVASFGFYNLTKTANLIAGLFLEPSLHTNTLRIEKLLHYALANCKGEQIPSSGRIESWLNRFEPIRDLAKQEDPAEDSFVTSVMTDRGNFRIYSGIWVGNGFYLQKILDAATCLSLDTGSLFRPINALLAISEAVAERNQTPYCYFPDNQYSANIKVPKYKKLDSLAQSLCFTEKQVAEMGFSFDDVRCFFANAELQENISIQQAEARHLEHYPIWQDKTRIVLLSPSAIANAIRKFVFEWVIHNNLQEAFEESLKQQYKKMLLEFHPVLLKRIENKREPFKKIHNSYFAETWEKIKDGSFLHFIVQVDTLDGFGDTGLEKVAPCITSQFQEINSRIYNFRDYFSKQNGLGEGITLIIHCGYGRVISGVIEKPFENWDALIISAYDFMTIAQDAYDNLGNLIWKLIAIQNKIQSENFLILNNNGLLNFYAWCKEIEQNFFVGMRKYLKSGSLSILIPPDCLLTVRKKVQQFLFPHVEIYVDKSFQRVYRTMNSIFKESQNKPLYEKFHNFCNPIMLGCAVVKSRPWWIRLDLRKMSLEHSMADNIWRALFLWMEKIAMVLEKQLLKLPTGPLLFSLNLENLSVDDLSQESNQYAFEDMIKIVTDKQANTIVLELTNNWLYYSLGSTNIAEKNLVCACITGVCKLGNIELSKEQMENLSNNIVPNPYAKHLHCFTEYSFRVIMDGVDDCEHIIADNLYHKFMNLHLADYVGRVVPKEVSGNEKCKSLLNEISANLWKELKEKLKTYNRRSLIFVALRNIEGIARKTEMSYKMAGAALAMHKDQQNVHQTHARQMSELNNASGACRIMIEMAICECPVEGGYCASVIDLQEIMPKILLLRQAGTASDLINKNATEALLNIEDGDIKYDQSFYHNVVVPFYKYRERILYQRSADNYEMHPENNETPNAEKTFFHTDFTNAFEKEFGVGIDALSKFQNEIERIAMSKKQRVFVASQEEILAQLKSISQSEVLSILQSFSLHTREEWDTPPTGYTGRDIYPWLSRRRLSLFARPLIKLTCHKNPEYIVSPGLSLECLNYIISTVYCKCSIEEDRCTSPEMKQWIGKERNRRGHEFNIKVATQLQKLGYCVKDNVDINSIVPSAGKNYGDIDVLAWKPDEEIIYAIECKLLYEAKNEVEIAEQWLEFRGEMRNDKPDRLKKHIDRVDFLLRHKSELLRFCGVDKREISRPFVVFSQPVPMFFNRDIKQLAVLTDLPKIITNGRLENFGPGSNL